MLEVLRHGSCLRWAAKQYHSLLNQRNIISWFLKYDLTRMHSSRMCTVRCSGRLSCHACPPPATHAPCHTHPSPSTPFTMHAPFTTHAPFTMHASPLCHACSNLSHMLPSPCMPPTFATHVPPPGQKEWYTLVKTLSFRNYCCGR